MRQLRLRKGKCHRASKGQSRESESGVLRAEARHRLTIGPCLFVLLASPAFPSMICIQHRPCLKGRARLDPCPGPCPAPLAQPSQSPLRMASRGCPLGKAPLLGTPSFFPLLDQSLLWEALQMCPCRTLHLP